MSSNNPTFLPDLGSRKVRRKQLKENVNTIVEFNFKVPGKRQNIPLKVLIAHSILSWYCEDYLGYLIREAVLKEKKRYSVYDQGLLDIILESKAHMQLFLLETQLWTDSKFFSTILVSEFWVTYRTDEEDSATSKEFKVKRHLSDFFFHQLLWKQNDARRVARKRGYDDHGTLLEQHEIHSTLPDDSGLQQYLLQLQRDSVEFTVLLGKAFIE